MYLGFRSAQQLRKNMAAAREKATVSVVKGRKSPALPEWTTLLFKKKINVTYIANVPDTAKPKIDFREIACWLIIKTEELPMY